MKNKNSLCIKLLIKHIKSKELLYKSFNFSYKTQKYKLEDILGEIIYLMKTGVSYRMLRSDIKWFTIYKVHRKLIKNNVFKMTFNEMLRKYLKKGLNGKLKYVLTDTTFIKNKYGKELISCNKYYYKKKGNKISLIVDSKGYILNINVYKGGKNDCKILEDHLDNDMPIDIDNEMGQYKQYFLADAGYDSKLIHDKLKTRKYIPLIEQNKRGIKNKQLIRRMTKREYKIYCKRVKVENVICKLKQLRRIEQRYDGLIDVYKNYVYLGAIYILC